MTGFHVCVCSGVDGVASDVLLLPVLSCLLSGAGVSAVLPVLFPSAGFVTSVVLSFFPVSVPPDSCLLSEVSFLTTSVVVSFISSTVTVSLFSLLTSVSCPLSATTFAVPATAASLTLKLPSPVFSAVPVTFTTLPAESFPSNTISPASLIVASPVSVTVLPSASFTCICISLAFATVAVSVDCSIFSAALLLAISFFAPQAVTVRSDIAISAVIIHFLILSILIIRFSFPDWLNDILFFVTESVTFVSGI